MKTIKYKYGHEVAIPKILIADAPTQGRFDEYADYILSTYNVEVTLEDSIKYLKRMGSWGIEELQDLDTNKARLLWISILDCKENETRFWYMAA